MQARMRLKRHQEEQGNVRKKDFRSRTPELQREGKKIMTTPRLILSFFLTTLKNRWTFLPCIFFFFYFILLFFRYVASSSVFTDLHYSVFIYIYIFVCFVTTVVCRPNHRRKNVTPRTDFLRFYSLLHSRQKMSLVSFFSGFIFLAHCQSRRGLRGAQRMKVRKRGTDKREENFTKNSTKCKRTRERKSNKELLRVQRT